MSKPGINPNPSPQWVKDALIEDYSRMARVGSTGATANEIESLALHDLAVHEAVQRDAKPAAPRVKKDRATEAPKAVVAQADAQGWELTKRPAPAAKRKRFAGFLDKTPANPKQAAAIMRLGQVLQPKSLFRPSKEFDYVLPRLAQWWVETMHDLDRNRGEFEGKSAADCERIVWRRVEDICDKSTGALGPWWVK